MISISKNAEPTGLANLRQNAIRKNLPPKVAFKTLRGPLKSKVRLSLQEEQGQLCAYCMCRIPRADVSPGIAPVILEHVFPRSPTGGDDIGQGLDYNNLVAVCNGNKAEHGTRVFADLTCDAHKENSLFKAINPCDASTLSTIYYELDGTITSNDCEVQSDLVDTLNLNCPSSPLISERKESLSSLILDIENVCAGDEFAVLEYCQTLLNAFTTETTLKTPYAGILIWYLKDMIAALTEI
ncbi:MAG: retron system putative HNH endonuclease [Faecalibacterium sp.]